MPARTTARRDVVWLIPCLLLFILIFPQPVYAAPAAPFPVDLPQPDGASVTAVAWGDEWNHGFETVDGYTILRDEASGFWAYAAPDGQSLAPGRAAGRLLIAGRDDPGGLPKHLRPSGASRSKTALPEGASMSGPQAAVNPSAGAPELLAAARPQAMFGAQKLLLLLVDFTNKRGTYSPESFRDKFFGATGSVKAFYQAASYGKLTIAPAEETSGGVNDGVIGWINLNYDNPSDSNQSPRIVNDALIAADASINYASFDTNKDGYLSNTELHIIVVAAGYEESYGNAPLPYVWAHRWTLDGGGYNPLLDGVRIGQSSRSGGYAIFGEIHTYLSNGQQVMPHQATIGVMAHELGHDLLWPDLYDTSGLSFGVGNWSIMGGGSWNTTHDAQMLYGDTPALPDAFSRYYQGWLAPTQAANNTTYALADSAGTPQALLMGSNPNFVDWDFNRVSGAGEYWLVENRARTGFDGGLPGCGVLVWHIDEGVTYTNKANANRDHPLIELIQADGRRDLYGKANNGDAGDPYPGSSGNVALNGTSAPAFKYYSGASSGLTLDVRSPTCASQMTVTYNYAAAPLPYRVNIPLVRR